MADPLYDLLVRHSTESTFDEGETSDSRASTDLSTKYLTRLVSLRLSDLTTTEPQSLAQASQSNFLSIQALSSRSYRTTTASSDLLSTLSASLQSLIGSTEEVRESIPSLDEQAVNFAKTYSKPRLRDGNTNGNDGDSSHVDSILASRKESQLLTRQADKLQDILELPALLSTAIAAAASGGTIPVSSSGASNATASATTSSNAATSSANYTQALDLFAHIKRLQNIYPDSQLIKSVVVEAELAMKDMTTNLVLSLRSQNIRLAAAIRTIGWLRRVVPELSNIHHQYPRLNESTSQVSGTNLSSSAAVAAATATASASTQTEGSFGALFLTARLATFLSMTEALAPLRDLADQETERRIASTPAASNSNTSERPKPSATLSSSRLASGNAGGTVAGVNGHQTERYLKRYIEIFREQSFSAISTFRQIFPASVVASSQEASDSTQSDETTVIAPPSALAPFPLHLIEHLTETLKSYLPNVTDPGARESLLMQTLYAANSLGKLGADFSMMISLLYVETTTESDAQESAAAKDTDETGKPKMDDGEKDGEANFDHKTTNVQVTEPEWVRVIKKHRVQSARLDALAAGQEQSSKRGSHDIAVR